MNFDSEKFTLHNVSSKIPTPVSFKRSASFRIPGEKADPLTTSENPELNNWGFWRRNLTPPNFRAKSLGKNDDDDLESIGSFANNFSTSSICEHVHFAKNGTTFSGRSHKYIVHCSSGLNEPEEYLTPTQRANRNIKRLKTLLQLAKEKLKEKEEEILRLNKEVVELKIYKASVQSTEKDPLELSAGFSPCEGTSHRICAESSPIRQLPDDTAKMSPAFSQDGFGEKTSITPDFLLSSLADSGNYDDMPSSASIYSKESLVATPELRQMSAFFNEDSEEKLKLVRMYEKKLDEKKLEYEAELNRVINEQEERNMKIIHEFEKKLKEEELKFESRWNELLKAAEEEKMAIVSRFEEKLEEERQKHKALRMEGKVTDMVYDVSYSQEMEEEKNIYETSLIDIKRKYENERAAIEEKFDEAMRMERSKFEESLQKIKEVGDKQVAELSEKVTKLEAEYSELLPKYEEVVTRNEELEKENESLKASLRNQEETQKKVYLELYKKGQEAAKLEAETNEEGESSSKKISVPELFAQLKITEVELENLKAMYKRLAEVRAKSAQQEKEKPGNDPEATLQFLKSAVYYFLTDRENHLGHLKAIESILAFSSTERGNIEKCYLNRY